MTGTSIFINDLSIFSKEIQTNLNEIIGLHNEIAELTF